MPLRNQTTTDIFTDTVATFPPINRVPVQVSNNPVQVEVNVISSSAPRGENWCSVQRLLPGFWNFTAADFARFGGDGCTGIRFKSDVSGSPGIVDVNV